MRAIAHLRPTAQTAPVVSSDIDLATRAPSGSAARIPGTASATSSATALPPFTSPSGRTIAIVAPARGSPPFLRPHLGPSPASGSTPRPSAHVNRALPIAHRDDRPHAAAGAQPPARQHAGSVVASHATSTRRPLVTPSAGRQPTDGPRRHAPRQHRPTTRPDDLDGNGTLYKPVVVDTTFQSSARMLEHYTVRTATPSPASRSRFGVSTMTLWWANKITRSRPQGRPGPGHPAGVGPDLHRQGTRHARPGARRTRSTREIVDPQRPHGPDPHRRPGPRPARRQGRPDPTPSPPRSRPGQAQRAAAVAVRRPAAVQRRPDALARVGGGNYISQYFHYGHYAIDIAADYGSPSSRRLAARSCSRAGSPTAAATRSISHGASIYTTYNHMSAIIVSRARTSRAASRSDASARAASRPGPHCHFAVSVGSARDGGTLVNPLSYY